MKKCSKGKGSNKKEEFKGPLQCCGRVRLVEWCNQPNMPRETFLFQNQANWLFSKGSSNSTYIHAEVDYDSRQSCMQM